MQSEGQAAHKLLGSSHSLSHAAASTLASWLGLVRSRCSQLHGTAVQHRGKCTRQAGGKHCNSLAFLLSSAPPVQQLEAAVIALWPRRGNALAADDMTPVQCSVTWKNLPPLQGIPPPPKGAAKALNQRQRSHYSNVVRNFYLETWYKFVTQHWVHNSDARAYAVTTETRECFGQLL